MSTSLFLFILTFPIVFRSHWDHCCYYSFLFLQSLCNSFKV